MDMPFFYSSRIKKINVAQRTNLKNVYWSYYARLDKTKGEQPVFLIKLKICCPLFALLDVPLTDDVMKSKDSRHTFLCGVQLQTKIPLITQKAPEIYNFPAVFSRKFIYCKLTRREGVLKTPLYSRVEGEISV